MKDTKLEKIVEWKNQDITNIELEEKADVIVASYMLNEIKNSEKLELLTKLWKNTNKILFIIEPGTPESYKNILRYREHIIQSGGYILAPCPHQNKCELPEDDWCHFTCRVERTKIHKNIKNADSPFEDEKFIYLIASKERTKGAESRILRHPKIEKGYVNVKLCTKERNKRRKNNKEYERKI